jgi:hypothetical protein
MMDFALRKPCNKCPFRTDVQPYLRTQRVVSILRSITEGDASFACHRTTAYDDDGEPIPGKKEQHCAGALILLEKIKQPNQLMRIGVRLNFYKPAKLRMDALVYDTPIAMVDAYRKHNNEKA